MVKKILTLLFIVTIILNVFNSCKVYADPNSSIGYAEYDDATAEEENNQMLEEQNQQVNQMASKSTNNYLKSLEVEGYNISPEFDKQTVDYTIDEEIYADKITIKAESDDSKARIDGIGEVQLISGENQCRIDVTAESGTIRTYIIKVKAINDKLKGEDIEKSNEEKIVEKYSKNQENDTKPNSFIIITCIVLLVILLIVTIVILKNRKKNGKHEK